MYYTVSKTVRPHFYVCTVSAIHSAIHSVCYTQCLLCVYSVCYTQCNTQCLLYTVSSVCAQCLLYLRRTYSMQYMHVSTHKVSTIDSVYFCAPQSDTQGTGQKHSNKLAQEAHAFTLTHRKGSPPPMLSQVPMFPVSRPGLVMLLHSIGELLNLTPHPMGRTYTDPFNRLIGTAV